MVDLHNIWEHIIVEIYPATGYSDEIISTLEESMTFSLKSTYNMLLNHIGNVAPLAALIWLKGCIKKHSFAPRW